MKVHKGVGKGKVNKFNKTNRKKIFDEYDEENDEENEINFSDNENEETSPKWYEQLPFVKLDHKVKCTESIARKLREEAEIILEEESKSYKSNLYSSKDSETTWMLKAAKTGTSSDKVAALTLIVQQSPVYNIYSLKALINMAKVSKKSQFLLVVDTLGELFLSDLLKPGKKLKKFNQQPLGNLNELSKGEELIRKKRLCYWLFEDNLKTLYQHFISLLNTASNDTVPNNRQKAIVIMNKLLLGNREQEEVIMGNLINKLGDPVHKVASTVVHCLEKVTIKYPSLKKYLLDETEKMLFRSNISQRAQYYGICFLCQFRYNGSADKQLARSIILVCFSFFKACVKTGVIDSRMMGALLVGVNRAYPYASRGMKKSDLSVIPAEYIDTMYKIVHLAPFKISLQALSLLLQISNSDRFYNALYKKLLDKELVNTSHQKIWLHLVFKALRKDKNLNRIKSFVKRLLQICQYFPVPLACGTLFMLSHMSKRHPDLFDKYSFVNNELDDVVANGSESLRKNDDERKNDVKFDDETAVVKHNVDFDGGATTSSSWYHRALIVPNMEVKEEPVVKHKPRTFYDPLHRNPAYAGGEHAVFSELLTLSRHYHPSVALFGKTILNGEKICYSGDPLADFALIRFLERFSFKNPKKPRQDADEEDKQELFRSVGTSRKHYNPKSLRTLPVQSNLYLNQSEFAIPVDELFLYRYLRDKRNKKLEADDSVKDDFSDVESVGSEEFNDYLDDLVKEKDRSLDFAKEIDHTKIKNKIKVIDTEINGDEEELDDEDDEEELNDDDEEELNDDNEDGEEELDDDDNENITDEYDEDVENENKESDDEASDYYSDDINGEDNELSNEKSDEEFDGEPNDDSSMASLQQAIRKKLGKNFKNMAMSTDEFSAMLEEAGQKKSGGLHDLCNRDNAGDKQLKWEASKVKQNWKNKPKRKAKDNIRRKTKKFKK